MSLVVQKESKDQPDTYLGQRFQGWDGSFKDGMKNQVRFHLYILDEFPNNRMVEWQRTKTIDFMADWMLLTVELSCENMANRETVRNDFTSSLLISLVKRRC